MKSKLGKGKLIAFNKTGFIDDALHTVLRPNNFTFFEGEIPTKLFYERQGVIRELSENIRDSRKWPKKGWKIWLEYEEKHGDGAHIDPEYYSKLTTAWLDDPESVGPVYVLFFNDGSWDIGDGWHRTAISVANNEQNIYAIWGEEKSPKR